MAFSHLSTPVSVPPSTRPVHGICLASIPHLPNTDIQPLGPHKPFPPLKSLPLLFANPPRLLPFDSRPLGQPSRTSARNRPGHGMPRPPGLSIHVHAIAAPDPDGHGPLGPLVFILQFMLALCDHEDAVAAKGKGRQSCGAQLADVAVHRHVVFLPVQQTHA